MPLQAAPRPRRHWIGTFLVVGEQVALALEHLRDLVILLGRVVLDAIQLVRELGPILAPNKLTDERRAE